MQRYFVRRDRRSYAGRPQGWRRVVPYEWRDVAPIDIVPEAIRAHWAAKKTSPFGYATIEGLSKEHRSVLVALAKGGKVSFEMNRQGDIPGFKIRTQLK